MKEAMISGDYKEINHRGRHFVVTLCHCCWCYVDKNGETKRHRILVTMCICC